MYYFLGCCAEDVVGNDLRRLDGQLAAFMNMAAQPDPVSTPNASEAATIPDQSTFNL